MKRIELLAPARDLAAVHAAVDYGADAVYIGGARFGARAAAVNTVDDIARAAEYAHRFGVRIHVTLNTVLFDGELAEAEALARAVVAAGADAIIVQDMAYRRMSLPVELHASTQVCNMSPERARFLGECGFARVILERGLSLAEIRAICEATDAEVECFVHGAICVGYSGRCFLSRSMSDRSGNRGECSQPCRLTYDLTDGEGRRYIEGKHLLSVRDMNLSHRIGEMLDAGVTSFKIEGRLKDERYIKNVVAYYRREIDECLASRPELCRASFGRSVCDFAPDPSKSFTRGESEYFFAGKRPGVASFDTPKSVGESVGRVASCSARTFTLDRDHTLLPGDGICFGGDGTSVNAVEGRRVTPNRMAGIAPGTEIFRNYDNRFALALDRSRTRRTLSVDAEVAVSAGRLHVRFVRRDDGASAEVVREGCFDAARDAAKMESTLRTQVAKSGDTIFSVESVLVAGAELFVPASVIADARREALDALAAVPWRTEHSVKADDLSVRYPGDRVTAEENVTNALSREFYSLHGVHEIEPPLETAASTAGRRVMRSAYCLRREIGECLKENPRLRGELYLERGSHRYRLSFDCERCEMSLYDDK
ncbi:MAG: U32 family peptidase [Alistipes sp.]|nr:U32 family peptidase [Alistipes sp.]